MKRFVLITVVLASIGCAGSLCSDESRTGSVEFLNSSGSPPNLPFSEAVRVGNTLYLSGRIGFVPETMGLAPGGIREETRQTMENIERSIEAHGYSMGDIVKCTVMLADISEWTTFNEVYKSFFKKPYPARSVFGANGLALGAQVEVECIAAAGGQGNKRR
uniref:Reactive intermediate/imine deaminase n=1 Tax=Candidatus Kentrum sp. FW TaxID=2126338 RepID=A0A450U1G3_9GAMM|nr:MAG: reactive intermediate/imine deaminase [Candidatus Kentron sp. FW]